LPIIRNPSTSLTNTAWGKTGQLDHTTGQSGNSRICEAIYSTCCATTDGDQRYGSSDNRIGQYWNQRKSDQRLSNNGCSRKISLSRERGDLPPQAATAWCRILHRWTSRVAQNNLAPIAMVWRWKSNAINSFHT
jgi:hypothetical protein